MPKQIISVNLAPKYTFSYNQLSNYNFNMTLLDENNQIVFSPVMCKDYFQEIFYSEYTGKSAAIFGLFWKKGMFNVEQEFFKVLLMGGGVSLKDHTKDLQKFLNYFDKSQGFQKTTVIETDNTQNIVVNFSKEWTQNGPLLSAFMTLLRLGGAYDRKSKKTALAYLKSIHPASRQKPKMPGYVQKDATNLLVTIERLAALLKGVKITHKWQSFSENNIHAVHDTGLNGYAGFPRVKVRLLRKEK